MVYEPDFLDPSQPIRKSRSPLSATRLAAASPAEQCELIIPAVRALSFGPVNLDDPYRMHRLTADWLQAQPSPATTAAYYADLLHFLGWCRGDPLRIYRPDAEQYVTVLSKRHAPSTVARKMAALSSWYTYLLTHDVATRNPFAGLKRPAVDRNRSATIGLSRSEAAAFLIAAGADPRPVRLRTAALLSLLLTEGLQVSEVCAADVTDLGYRGKHRSFTVRSKNGKRRDYPLTPPTAAALEDYLRDRASRAGLDRDRLTGPLFITEPSGPHPGGKRMDRWAITKLIRRIARDTRISTASKLTPHSLRRTFATLALDAGAALREVQEAMGHADPRTTQAYDRTYDRNEESLDRHPARRVLAHLEEGIAPSSGEAPATARRRRLSSRP